jgi:hypothetical protein
MRLTEARKSDEIAGRALRNIHCIEQGTRVSGPLGMQPWYTVETKADCQVFSLPSAYTD